MTLSQEDPRPRTSGQVPHDSLVRVDRRVREILARAERTGTPVAEIPPTITATLEDGPLAGTSVEVGLVEGRPPKTIDAAAEDGSTCRYCLADWVQSGRSAAYTFLYRV